MLKDSACITAACIEKSAVLLHHLGHFFCRLDKDRIDGLKREQLGMFELYLTKTILTDLTDSQREHIKELLPKVKRQRRPRELKMRVVVDAILYVVVGGIQWRMLPKDFPKWQSVYYYFRLWRTCLEWLRLHDR
jgi:hypothetical protein